MASGRGARSERRANDHQDSLGRNDAGSLLDNPSVHVLHISRQRQRRLHPLQASECHERGEGHAVVPGRHKR
eukprot:3869101-Alexandrium_andersonii.AAC.1